jgi:hypothetical protein
VARSFKLEVCTDRCSVQIQPVKTAVENCYQTRGATFPAILDPMPITAEGGPGVLAGGRIAPAIDDEGDHISYV